MAMQIFHHLLIFISYLIFSLTPSLTVDFHLCLMTPEAFSRLYPTRKPWDNCHVSWPSAKEPGLTKLVEAIFAYHPLAICMALYDYETHSNPQRLNMYYNMYTKRMLYMFSYPTSFSIISFQGALPKIRFAMMYPRSVMQTMVAHPFKHSTNHLGTNHVTMIKTSSMISLI